MVTQNTQTLLLRCLFMCMLNSFLILYLYLFWNSLSVCISCYFYLCIPLHEFKCPDFNCHGDVSNEGEKSEIELILFHANFFLFFFVKFHSSQNTSAHNTIKLIAFFGSSWLTIIFHSHYQFLNSFSPKAGTPFSCFINMCQYLNEPFFFARL